MGRPKGVVRRLADETGINQATVRRGLAAAGMSQQACEADFTQAFKIISALADKDRVIGHATHGRGEGGHSSVDSFADAKAQAERHRARKLELQNAQLEGSLISRADVTDTVFRVLADLRVALMAVSVRLAPNLAGLSDQKAIARLIEDDLRQTLTAFADPNRMLAGIEEEDALS